MKFVINKSIFGDRLEEFIKLCDSWYIPTYVMEEHDHIAYPEKFKYNEDTFYFVNLSTARYLLRSGKSYGLEYDNNIFNVSHYASKLGEEYINDPFILIPNYLWLKYRYTQICQKVFGDKVFVKSDSGNKLFTGQEIDFTQSIDSDYPFNLVIAATKELEPIEYRFWVYENQIITHSSYSWDTELNKQNFIPPKKVVQYAEKIKKTLPMLTYVLDICLWKNIPKVVDINAFSTSGIYHANLEALVEPISLQYQH